MLLLVLLASFCYGTWAECPISFTLVRNGECHRRLYDGRLEQPGAYMPILFCAEYNAIPANIKNQEDHDFWVGVAKADSEEGLEFGYVILGIQCAGGNWTWADGRSVKNEWKPQNYDQALDDFCEPESLYDIWTIDYYTNNWKKWNVTYKSMDAYCVIEPTPKLVESDVDCADFDHDDQDDVCYQVGKTAGNYAEANSICQSFGANVASIHNQLENDFIRRLAASKGLVNGMIVGAKLNSTSNYQWADGTAWDFDNFAPGFPLPGCGECLGMVTNNVGGQWINVDCDAELPFACVRQPGDVDQVCNAALHKENDIIYSPGFPYDASIPCDFMLQVEPGMLVEVEILMLEANSCCDRLVLSEGTLGGTEIATLTGEIRDLPTTSRKIRTTTQNMMRVSWQPKGGVNVKGAMLTFRAVSPDKH